ncbi:prepilin peptidase [Paenibacillus wynnii]|uniref:prepilin peptidase n=1 Tax=Paenibacillus wynnii TaxID=268407 RepID=UPI0027923DDC|nr:A24 family peptidase [Paenibacillus wynnii]MDQ0192152.1 leader peptidase (prepilin peptidase)/N-methyltransferase [Paenibacillus wynnii]
MTIFIAIYITLLGLVLGSFFNVVALRVPAGESLLHPPSQCPKCSTRLGVRDLFPVFSYLLSGGKCRYCGVKVSLLYPLGEAATGLLFLWIYLKLGLSMKGFEGLLLVSLSVIITVSDLKYMLIPNKVLLFFLPLFLVLVPFMAEDPLWVHALGALCGGGILLLLALFGGMGMGDVKLFALLGWVIGWPNVILAFLVACALGAAVGVGLQLSGIIHKKQPVPFGPFLVFGTLLAFLYGPDIIGFYLTFIG